MIASNTTSEAARYLLIQHVPDVFRQEPRNVGVVVEQQGRIAAKFYGELDDGRIDGRALRTFKNPSVYSQWVRFWRRMIERQGELALETLLNSATSNFPVLDAGFLTGGVADSIDNVCHYAYSMLVSEGGLAEALGRNQEFDEALANLREEMSADFRRLGVFNQRPSFEVPHPIQPFVVVKGTRHAHQMSYVQQGRGLTIVIEPVNFITRQRQAAKDHAGWAAHAFGDIVDRLGNAAMPIAVARYSRETEADELLSYSLSLLEEVATVVDWSSAADRRGFLGARESFARGG